MSAALAVSASKGAALLVGLGPIWLTVLLVSFSCFFLDRRFLHDTINGMGVELV